MIRTKDHKTLNMFDSLDHLGPRRRQLLEQSWAPVFRKEILPELPVEQVAPFYSEQNGAPTKELYAMLGLMLAQQTFDLTDKEAVRQFAFNFEWHHALGIGDDSDQSAYVSEKTLWNMRRLLTEHDLYQAMFEIPTKKLAELCGVDPSLQRLDSVHVFSNMRHLGRIGLFVRTIKKFLHNLKRQCPGSSGFGKLEKELSERYLHKQKTSAFSMVKPSETTKTLQSLAEDLLVIVRCFKEDAKVNSMSSYKLLMRLFEEQCVTENGEDGGERIQVRPNKEIASDSLQNPSDPDAGYDGYKGQGYQVQIAETYSTDEEEPALSLITHVAVESADKHDCGALIPALERTQKLGLAPEKILADTAYGSDDNHQKAQEQGVGLIAPVPGKEPGGELSLADFSFSEHEKVSACPQGQVPFKQSLNKTTRTAFFARSTCAACSKRSQCPVLEGKRGHRLRYDGKQLRNARRRAFEATPLFMELYRFRAGVEATMSQYDRKTGVKHLRVRGFKNVAFCATLKAAGINLLRATAFINRKDSGAPGPNTPTGAWIHLFQASGGRIRQFQALCSWILDQFRDLAAGTPRHLSLSANGAV